MIFQSNHRISEMSSPMETENSKDGTAEVSSARNRLSGALNVAERIVDKYAGEDFPVSPIKRFQGLDSPFPSPSKSPRGVRRRRKKPIPLNTAFHHTFVMKLFDRSVDLAQFPDFTPLYPVCRAWMKNDPHNTNMAPRLRTPTPEPEDEEKEDSEDQNSDSPKENPDPDVYKLPPPEPLGINAFGEEESLRVPNIEMPPLQKGFKVPEDSEGAPETSTLLSGHLKRWQGVRKSWKDAAYENEKRYEASMKILTKMFET